MTNLPENFDLKRDDPSLNGDRATAIENEYRVDPAAMNRLFFAQYHLEYVSRYFNASKNTLRVLTYPWATNTCYEKANILGTWNPLNIIKAFYLASVKDGSLYAVVIPETGCFIDKARIKGQLGLPEDDTLVKATELPQNMNYGTCSPFILENDLQGQGGRVAKIVFDTETLIQKKHENILDDFSFGLDHQVSIQMNYYQCYKVLKSNFHQAVMDCDILKLAFTERFTRKEGRIKIDYEFQSLNYRTAKFINSIHGYGDVKIVNDCVDELYLPDVLTTQNNGTE
jgi:hypothetical protein